LRALELHVDFINIGSANNPINISVMTIPSRMGNCLLPLLFVVDFSTSPLLAMLELLLPLLLTTRQDLLLLLLLLWVKSSEETFQ